MTAPARIKQAEITRAMKGAKDAGFSRVRVSIDVLGNLVIDASDDPAVIVDANPLDRLLRPR
jgi:hypothetical protein